MFDGINNEKKHYFQIDYYNIYEKITKKKIINGENKEQIIYYSNGNIKCIIKSYKNHQNFQCFYKNGNLLATFKKEDVYLDGLLSLFYSNGRIMATCTFKENNFPILLKRYDKNGIEFTSRKIGKIIRRIFNDKDNELMHIEFIFPFLKKQMIFEIFENII
ncbi:hypothetical protein [Fusobacterium sp. PH5-44]|uniref:hypothetical protein n=1 Tax=unclassified Fusobacterium TaxID=2648384 RepID=UPI003D1D9F79